MSWFELIVYFGTPFLAGWLARRKGLGWLDPVLTCYSVGLLLANSGVTVDESTTTAVTEVVVPLAIPLLLFKTNFVRWLRGSRATIIGFGIALFSALVSLAAGAWLFRGQSTEIPDAAGMLAGSWTGGSPNLVSVAAALSVPHETLVLTNAADLFVGGIYLLALLTFARPLLARVLHVADDIEPMHEAEDVHIGLKTRALHGAVASLAGLAIVAAAAGLSLLLSGELSAPAVILGITTGGIAASFSARLRDLHMSYEIGNYLILVFCTAIGALTDLRALLEGGSTFLGFAAVALTSTVVLHFALCRLAKIDVDTAIITSVATVMGPPLVVPVARRLDNRAAFVSGITSGLIGYAIGNYAGLATAIVVQAMMPG